MNDRPQDEARYDPGTDEHRAGRPSPPVDGLEEPLTRIEDAVCNLFGFADICYGRSPDEVKAEALAAVGEVRAEVARLRDTLRDLLRWAEGAEAMIEGEWGTGPVPAEITAGREVLGA